MFYRTLEITYTMQYRVMTYLLPSMIVAILLNIPKFLEAKYGTTEYTDENNFSREVVNYTFFVPTSLRGNPDYLLYYQHWTRLIVTGLIPFCYLAIMNLLIFSKIRQNNQVPVRSRSKPSKKARNLATILIVIGVVKNHYC